MLRRGLLHRVVLLLVALNLVLLPMRIYAGITPMHGVATAATATGDVRPAAMPCHRVSQTEDAERVDQQVAADPCHDCDKSCLLGDCCPGCDLAHLVIGFAIDIPAIGHAGGYEFLPLGVAVPPGLQLDVPLHPPRS